MQLQKIQPCLWFDGNAAAAVDFYTGIFPNSRIDSQLLAPAAVGEAGGAAEGSVLTLEFELDGQRFMALNGGPMFKFTEAISLMILCEDQAEMDHYWNNLSAGGPNESQQCGWLKDKFGVSWQVVPIRFMEMVKDSDPRKVARVMAAMMEMKKLDLAKLEQAYTG